MRLTGQQQIAAPQYAVYDALNDADILKNSIPGCEELRKKSPTEFAAIARVKIGPVSAKFGGDVTLSDINPPNGYVISGQGAGGAAGFAKGKATIRLSENDGKTTLAYEVEAQIGGKIAQVGARLIDGAAKKLAKEFFDRFAAQLQPDAGAAPSPAPSPSPESAPPAAGEGIFKRYLRYRREKKLSKQEKRMLALDLGIAIAAVAAWLLLAD